MKKVIFLFTMLFFMVISVFAETQKTTITINGTTPTIETSTGNVATQNATNQVYDSTKLTVEKVYSEVKAGVVGMAKALKAPAEHVYQIMCKQQLVNSIVILMLFVIGVIFLFIGIVLGNHEQADWDEASLYTVGCVFSLLISFVLVIFSLAQMGDCITGFVNPEYGAIKDIIGFFK